MERILEELVRHVDDATRPEVDLYLVSGPVLRGRVIAVRQGLATVHTNSDAELLVSYIRVEHIIAVTVSGQAARTEQAPSHHDNIITPVNEMSYAAMQAAMEVATPPDEIVHRHDEQRTTRRTSEEVRRIEIAQHQEELTTRRPSNEMPSVDDMVRHEERTRRRVPTDDRLIEDARHASDRKARAEASRAELARAEAARGDSARGDSTRGDATGGDAARGDVARRESGQHERVDVVRGEISRVSERDSARIDMRDGSRRDNPRSERDRDSQRIDITDRSRESSRHERESARIDMRDGSRRDNPRGERDRDSQRIDITDRSRRESSRHESSRHDSRRESSRHDRDRDARGDSSRSAPGDVSAAFSAMRVETGSIPAAPSDPVAEFVASQYDVVTPAEPIAPLSLELPPIEAPTFLGERPPSRAKAPTPISPAALAASDAASAAIEATFSMRGDTPKPKAVPRPPSPTRPELMRLAGMHAELLSRAARHRVEVAIGAPLDDDSRRAIGYALPATGDVLLAMFGEGQHRGLERITSVELVAGEVEVVVENTRLVVRCSLVDRWTPATLRSAIERAAR